MSIADAAADYAAAHRAHLAATARAQAASALHAAERTRATHEAMGDAWRACDKAMRVMFAARDRLCEAAVDSGQGVLL